MNEHTSTQIAIAPSILSRRQSRPLLFALASLIILLLAGCSQSTGAMQSIRSAPAAAAAESLVADIEGYAVPTPTPLPEIPEDSYVVISTGGARANLRSGPSTESDIVSKGYPGEAYQVVGRSEDGSWWQICCAQGPDDGEGEATTTVWVAASVVTTDGAAAALASGEPILPDEFEASWELEWQCGSTRCSVNECPAVVTAKSGEISGQWIPVEHDVAWEDSCFPADTWAFEIDKFSGEERTGEFADNFLYRYWIGAEPGEANGVVELEGGRNVAVWCSGPHSVEIAEGGGWITVYDGNTCHDTRTGLLVLLDYTKRWLFSGEYDGQTYERAYFGDSESLQQQLADTNLELLLVEPIQ